MCEPPPIHLDSESKERSIITLLPLQCLLLNSILLRLLVFPVPPPVLPTIVARHNSTDGSAHRQESNQDTVSLNILRPIPRQINETGQDTTQVATHSLHGQRDGPLGGPARVIPVPGHALRHVGVDAAREEEGAGVLYVDVALGNEHDQSDDADQVPEDHEDAAGGETVGQVAGGEAADAGDDVGRDSHELGLVVGVAEVADDGGEEEGEGVDGGEGAEVC